MKAVSQEDADEIVSLSIGKALDLEDFQRSLSPEDFRVVIGAARSALIFGIQLGMACSDDETKPLMESVINKLLNK